MEIHAKSKKKRFYPIDWCLLFLVLLLVVGGAFRMMQASARDGEETTVLYTLCLIDASETIAKENGGWEALMPLGAAVTTERGSLMLGSVEAVFIRPTLVPTVTDGAVTFLEKEGYTDLYVTVRAKARYRAEDCCRVGDLPILCGNTGDYRIGGYLARGCRIVRVERSEAN